MQYILNKTRFYLTFFKYHSIIPYFEAVDTIESHSDMFSFELFQQDIL